MHITYVFHSQKANNYLVDYSTKNTDERTREINAETEDLAGKADDWKMVYNKKFSEKTEAVRFKRKIKNKGAKKFLAQLE